MSFLLDTNILSAHLKGGYPRLESKFMQHGGQLYTSTLNLGELYVWAYKSPKSVSRLQDIAKLIVDVKCLDICLQTAEIFGSIRTHQIATGTLTPTLDLFIACAALLRDYTIVTHNTADFANIPGLRVVDWLAP